MPCEHESDRDTYLDVRLMISLGVDLYCFASAKRAAMPTKNEENCVNTGKYGPPLSTDRFPNQSQR